MADDHGYKLDKERMEALFKELDKNKDGKIDVDELAEGLKKLGGRYTPGQAEVTLSCNELMKSMNSNIKQALFAKTSICL